MYRDQGGGKLLQSSKEKVGSHQKLLLQLLLLKAVAVWTCSFTTVFLLTWCPPGVPNYNSHQPCPKLLKGARWPQGCFADSTADVRTLRRRLSKATRKKMKRPQVRGGEPVVPLRRYSSASRANGQGPWQEL